MTDITQDGNTFNGKPHNIYTSTRPPNTYIQSSRHISHAFYTLSIEHSNAIVIGHLLSIIYSIHSLYIHIDYID